MQALSYDKIILTNYLANNLTPRIQRLDLFGMNNFNDEHVKLLVKRCQDIRVLDLGMTGVTKHCLPSIIKHLKSLEELGFQDIDLPFLEILQLGSLPQLKLLYCNQKYISGPSEVLGVKKVMQGLLKEQVLLLHSKVPNKRAARLLTFHFPQIHPYCICDGFRPKYCPLHFIL